jgi:hypothetical protein
MFLKDTFSFRIDPDSTEQVIEAHLRRQDGIERATREARQAGQARRQPLSRTSRPRHRNHSRDIASPNAELALTICAAMIEREPGTDWRDLQARVAGILSECGIDVEVGRRIVTTRATVEIDVYGTDRTATPPSIYLCECKRWRSAVPQGEVLAFSRVVADSEAHHGLFISAAGFQSGAYQTVQHTNIQLLSWREFQELFVERWCERYWVPTFRSGADRLAAYVDPVSSDAAVRDYRGEPLEPEEAVGLMAHEMWGEPFNNVLLPRDRPRIPLSPAIWPLRDKYQQYLPDQIRRAGDLRELLESLLTFTAEWMRRTGRV